MLGFCEGLAEVMFKFVGIVMQFAPIGIGAAMAVTVSHSGIQVLENLGMLVLTLYGALVVFALVALRAGGAHRPDPAPRGSSARSRSRRSSRSPPRRPTRRCRSRCSG